MFDSLSNQALALTLEGDLFGPNAQIRPIQALLGEKKIDFPSSTDNLAQFPFAVPSGLADVDWSTADKGATPPETPR
jgi:hypothetical protein